MLVDCPRREAACGRHRRLNHVSIEPRVDFVACIPALYAANSSTESRCAHLSAGIAYRSIVHDLPRLAVLGQVKSDFHGVCPYYLIYNETPDADNHHWSVKINDGSRYARGGL